jgi:hypothetical protein
MGNVDKARIDQIFSVRIVVFTRHTADTLGRVCQNRLGGRERFACGKLPGEVEIVDTARKTRIALRADLCLL